MSVTIEPEFEQFQLLKTPLTNGEQTFVERITQFFANQPDREIEIYVQPNINGSRPDILCIEKSTAHRHGGIWIIEIKDWNLDYVTVKTTGKHQQWSVHDRKQREHVVRSPLQQVGEYSTLVNQIVENPIYQVSLQRNQLIESSNELFYQMYQQKAANFLVNTAVYFHKHTKAPFDIDASYTQLFFRNFSNQELAKFFQSSRYAKLTEQSYQSIKQYLGVMAHELEQSPVVLDTKQAAILNDFKQGQTRKKFIGAAGVGKTELLAQMIAHSLDQGQEVLVLTYNITLKYFLRDRIRTALRQSIKNKSLSILHYHGFIQAEMNRYGLPIAQNFLKQADQRDLFAQVTAIPKYDAIFIDECQDYKDEWIGIIQTYFLKEGGTYVVCGDANQNIYSRTMADKKLPQVSILGRPNELSINHRALNPIVNLADRYKQQFLAAKYDVPEVTDSQLSTSTSPVNQASVLLCEINDRAAFFDKINQDFVGQAIHPNDVALLSFTKERLRLYIDQYNQGVKEGPLKYRQITRYSRTVCTTEEVEQYSQKSQSQLNERAIQKHERLLKMNFNPNYGTTKALTVNSLKGLEINQAILFLDDLEAALLMDTSIHELLYTALTRAKERLFICYDPSIIKNKEVQASIDFLEACVNHQSIIKEKI